MNELNPPAPGADWTAILRDPDVVSHMGELLQAYRGAPPEKRNHALLAALKEIKCGTAEKRSAPKGRTDIAIAPPETVPSATPPFEPDIFTPTWGEDRRRYPRMKCFVAVELREEFSYKPIWGNLSNISPGGCFVETATPFENRSKLNIGLWVANGEIWVKGLVLSGVVTRTNPCFGVRIKFADLGSSQRETLRQFLKYVESTTKSYQKQEGYLAQMKR
jgi:hypothetical protein